MPWWFHVVESAHELQNPTSVDKVRLLGERLRLGPRSRVLDVGSGRGGPALVLAHAFGCRITCVERSEEFLGDARRRVLEAGLGELIDLVRADGRDFQIEPEAYDAALCLGASFIWGGLDATLAALVPGVRPGGAVAIGEPYWRGWPLPAGFQPDADQDFRSLPAVVELFESAHLAPIALIAASEDDWDRYESLHWLALEDWLGDHEDDPDATAFRERGRRQRERYLRWERDLIGWAMVAARKDR